MKTMEIKGNFLVTTDDLNQEDWSLFDYFDELKKEFPSLRVLAFFTPFWKQDVDFLNSYLELKDPGSYFTNKEFLQFLLERQDWLSLASHGLFHIQAEFSMDIQFQQKMFALSAAIRNYFCELGIQFQPACKPPFYKFNEIGFELSKHFGFHQLFLQNGIADFKENKFITREEIGLIDSHVSTGCPMPDRIDKFYEKLRLILKGELKDKKEFHYG